jgi:hypothetical protein
VSDLGGGAYPGAERAVYISVFGRQTAQEDAQLSGQAEEPAAEPEGQTVITEEILEEEPAAERRLSGKSGRFYRLRRGIPPLFLPAGSARM